MLLRKYKCFGGTNCLHNPAQEAQVIVYHTTPHNTPKNLNAFNIILRIFH